MSKQVADIIVETLQSAGVRHCYGVVGDTLNLIARSLERSKIEWVSSDMKKRARSLRKQKRK
jgi:pyruvate dehydrogenase (quinone)